MAAFLNMLSHNYTMPLAGYPLAPLASSIPTTCDAIALYNAVNTIISSDMENVCRKLMPSGRRIGNFFETSNIIISLDGHLSHCANIWRRPGAWFDMAANVLGADIIGLFAYCNRRSYEWSLEAFRDNLQIDKNKIYTININDVSGWVEERFPLRCEFDNPVIEEVLRHSDELIGRYLYRNSSGAPTTIAELWHTFSDGSISIYRQLCRRKKDGQLRWLGLMPSQPILFAADLIAANPSTRIEIHETERQAAESPVDRDVLHSAVPGGIGNLVNADLTGIAGRQVYVDFDPCNLARGLLIREKLREAHAVEPRFKVGLDDQARSFDDIEKYAASRGIELTPVKNDQCVSQLVIQKPGEAIPGGDLVRKMLLYPIIQEGELIWIFAAAKLGKTWLGLSIINAVTTGYTTVGKWRSHEGFGGLYVDGEMSPDGLEKAIRMVMAGAGNHSGNRRFSILCAKSSPSGMIDLEDEETQRTIEAALSGLKLLILDNFQSLTSNGPNALKKILAWLRRITRSGVAVVFLDHTNRKGDLQGSIQKERIADLTISMRHPDDDGDDDSDAKADGRILIEFPAPRRLYGDDARKFEVLKVSTEASEGAAASFSFELVEAPEVAAPEVPASIKRMALAVFARDTEHLSYPKIEATHGIPLSTAFGDYKASKTLVGYEKSAFDTELQRLIELHRPSSD